MSGVLLKPLIAGATMATDGTFVYLTTNREPGSRQMCRAGFAAYRDKPGGPTPPATENHWRRSGSYRLPGQGSDTGQRRIGGSEK